MSADLTDFYNPYRDHGANLENSATRVFPVAIPADDVTALPRACKALRIVNPDAASHTLTYMTVAGDQVTITLLANSIWVEAAVIAQIFNSGTYAGLLIHGYSD